MINLVIMHAWREGSCWWCPDYSIDIDMEFGQFLLMSSFSSFCDNFSDIWWRNICFLLVSPIKFGYIFWMPVATSRFKLRISYHTNLRQLMHFMA